MNKLVCESLDEFNLLLETEKEEGNVITGPISGTWKYASTLPARTLRKLRARTVMKKYKDKLVLQIDKIFKKYQPAIKELVARTQSAVNKIDSEADSQIQATQKQDILTDMEDNFKALLNNIKDAMQGQLKIYADSLQNRLERPGTITKTEFMPEDKTALLAEWKLIETQINQLIQRKLITLLDDKDISKYTKLKATLQNYVKKINPYYSNIYGVQDEESDTDLITDKNQLELYQKLTDLEIPAKSGKKVEFDTLYFIKDPNNFKTIHAKMPSLYIKFKVDDNGKIYIAFYKYEKRAWNKLAPPIYLLEPGETTQNKAVIDKLQALQTSLKII